MSNANAQICTGDLGLPIAGAGTDFGSGTNNFGTPLFTNTSYNFVTGIPNDGFYTIVKNTNNLNTGWHQNISNHTPNDPNGYMMVVNASNQPGIFYQTTIANLCPGTTYEFASYIINILRNPGIRPNIKFTIENNGTVIKEFSTGDIPEGSPTDWIKYGTIFKTPNNVGVITLKMTNENPGGNGNDLALDDITFRPCGPTIKPEILGKSSTSTNICENNSATFNLSATVSAAYVNPVFQWQTNDGTGWKDLTSPGAQSTNATVNFTNAIIGTYQYQLLVAESGNLNSVNCRIVSSPLTIHVEPQIKPDLTYTGQACEGSAITLGFGATNANSYEWIGPNGFSSSEKNPTLNNLKLSDAGKYQVTLTNTAGCKNIGMITLNISPKIVPIINASNDEIDLCEQQNVQLVASGGKSYTWSPIEGLSNPNIANPIASPSQTTTYTVTIKDGDCNAMASVKINVLKLAVANAGADIQALFGQSVTLNGNANGDKISYSWSPAAYLDDPTKLNPIASPPTTTVYTLTVKSACNTITDEVSVNVYPKIEIPNTFTPNGDGKNDTWSIPALAAFSTAEVTVLSRNGQTVYQNKGLYKPWDGKFRNKELPAGTYYYRIYLNTDFKTLSGWLFITR